MRFEGVFECFLPIFDLENTILGLFPGVFKSRFGYRVWGSNFKSHSYILNCISYCSVRWAESIGANIFRIRPSYHRLRLKTVQKCQKARFCQFWAYFLWRIYTKRYYFILYLQIRSSKENFDTEKTKIECITRAYIPVLS